MSKFRIAIAVAVLAGLSASPALARGFGLGGLMGGVRSALTRVLPLGIHRVTAVSRLRRSSHRACPMIGSAVR